MDKNLLHVWRVPLPGHLPGKEVLIHIVKDADTLRAWSDEICQQKTHLKGLLGVHHGCIENSSGVRVSLIVLAKDLIGASYVAHEIQHAVHWLLGPRKLHEVARRVMLRSKFRDTQSNRDPDEQAAQLCEFITRKFWQKWFRYGQAAARI